MILPQRSQSISIGCFALPLFTAVHTRSGTAHRDMLLPKGSEKTSGFCRNLSGGFTGGSTFRSTPVGSLVGMRTRPRRFEDLAVHYEPADTAPFGDSEWCLFAVVWSTVVSKKILRLMVHSADRRRRERLMKVIFADLQRQGHGIRNRPWLRPRLR